MARFSLTSTPALRPFPVRCGAQEWAGGSALRTAAPADAWRSAVLSHLLPTLPHAHPPHRAVVDLGFQISVNAFVIHASVWANLRVSKAVKYGIVLRRAMR